MRFSKPFSRERKFLQFLFGAKEKQMMSLEAGEEKIRDFDGGNEMKEAKGERIMTGTPRKYRSGFGGKKKEKKVEGLIKRNG